MVNFQQIAEDCLAGKLSGTFVLRNGKEVNSKGLIRNNSIYHPYTFFDKPFTYTNNGSIYNGVTSSHECDIVNFIPDDMQEQIKIDIPEGKVPVMEQTESGVVITWKDHELTYTEILNEFRNNVNCIHTSFVNSASQAFHKKVEVIRKLTNIRNYFGKPENDKGYGIFYHEYYKKYYVDIVHPFNSVHVCFNTKEQAEQAIKILGDDVKYLFEPW